MVRENPKNWTTGMGKSGEDKPQYVFLSQEVSGSTTRKMEIEDVWAASEIDQTSLHEK
jgi:hypothetical protein